MIVGSINIELKQMGDWSHLSEASQTLSSLSRRVRLEAKYNVRRERDNYYGRNKCFPKGL